jgi:hypothetical protein
MKIHSFSAKLLTTTSEKRSPSKRVNMVEFQTSSSKQMNPSNNTLSSVYVNPYNQDSNTIQNSLGEYESEAFGSIQQSLKKSRALVRENSE